MANYKGHIAGGAVLAGIYTIAMIFAPVERFAEYAALLYDWQAMFAVFVIGMLFALFPDVDTNSKGQDLFYWLIFHSIYYLFMLNSFKLQPTWV